MTLEFHGGAAVVMGMDDYHHGIAPLRIAGNDFVRLASIVEQAHGGTR